MENSHCLKPETGSAQPSPGTIGSPAGHAVPRGLAMLRGPAWPPLPFSPSTALGEVSACRDSTFLRCSWGGAAGPLGCRERRCSWLFSAAGGVNPGASSGSAYCSPLARLVPGLAGTWCSGLTGYSPIVGGWGLGEVSGGLALSRASSCSSPHRLGPRSVGDLVTIQPVAPANGLVICLGAKKKQPSGRGSTAQTQPGLNVAQCSCMLSATALSFAPRPAPWLPWCPRTGRSGAW